MANYRCVNCGNVFSSENNDTCPECGFKGILINNDLQYTDNNSSDANYDYSSSTSYSSLIADQINGFAKVFWTIGLICGIFVYVTYFIQIWNSEIFEYSMGTGIVTIIVMTIILAIVLAMLYFNVLLLKGFAAIVNNTDTTNEKLDSIINALNNQK